MNFRVGVFIHTISFFLRSFFQEVDNTDTDDTDDEVEEENTDDLHKSMSGDTDNIFDFVSDFC